jgi:hypothetical protein
MGGLESRDEDTPTLEWGRDAAADAARSDRETTTGYRRKIDRRDRHRPPVQAPRAGQPSIGKAPGR